MIQIPTSFNIEELNLHGLTFEEFNDNRWCMLSGFGRKEIIRRALDLENRIFPDYVIDAASTSSLAELCNGLLTKDEAQTVIDVLAHKGSFVRMHHAFRYNSPEQEAKVIKLEGILSELKPGEKIRLMLKPRVPPWIAKNLRGTHGITFILSAEDQRTLFRLENGERIGPVAITPELRYRDMSWRQFVRVIEDVFDEVELVT